MKPKPDYIRVWYCNQCAIYEIDFANEKSYCQHCGRKMIARTYVEVEKKTKQKSIYHNTTNYIYYLYFIIVWKRHMKK